MEAIRKWEEAYQNLDVQKNAALQQLFNQTREMENLPIIIDKNIIHRINMLRSVRRNDDMGVYPDEMIHCICEAMHNICHNADYITKGVEKSRLKMLLEPMKLKIRKLADSNYPMEKKRQILSKSYVGKGVFTVVASFVIPTLISMLTESQHK